MDLADLASQHARQHIERREDARDLQVAIVAGLATISTENRQAHTALATKQAEISTQIAVIQAGLLGAWERRGLLMGGLAVLLLLILLLATSRGVSTTEAVDGVLRLTPAAASPLPAAAFDNGPAVLP